MAYSVLLILNNDHLKRKIKQRLDGHRDAFVICGQTDSMVVGMSFIEELRPHIVVTTRYMSFWNAEELIRRFGDSHTVQFVLLCDEANLGHEELYSQPCVSGALSLEDFDGSAFMKTLENAAAQWETRASRQLLRKSKTPAFFSYSLWEGEVPMMDELFSGVKQARSEEGRICFRDYDGEQVCIPVEQRATVMLARPAGGVFCNFYRHVDQVAVLFKRLTQLMQSREGGYVTLRAENEMGILLLGGGRPDQGDRLAFAGQVNALMHDLDLPPLQFTMTDRPVQPDGWHDSVKELGDLQRYFFFFTQQSVLTRGWLEENKWAVRHEEMESLLGRFRSAANELDEGRLHSEADILFQLVEHSRSFNILSFVWSQLLLQYSMLLHAHKTHVEEMQEEALPSWQDYPRLDSAREAMVALYTQLLQRLKSMVLTGNMTILRALEYMRGHKNRRLTLQDVAGEVFISPSYLSRMIKKETGQSFVDNLNTMRIAEAKQLLAARGKIMEVGPLVGFENVKYFSQVFKKHTGMTPQAYRSQAVKGELS